MGCTSISGPKILLLFCAGCLSTVSAGQMLHSKGASITVQPNTTISIKGSVENEGIIVNNGHLKVGGPWINSGVYAAGSGQITFNGGSKGFPQIIHHNGQTFNRINIAGGTKKIILSDLVIGKEIHFGNGIIEAAGTSGIFFDPDVMISGASDSSHIHGTVYQKGSGYKLFPIGNGLIYLPVELPDVEDPSSVIGVQAFEFESVSLAKPMSIESISDKRYWHIEVVNGSLPQSRVVLPFRDENWTADPEKIVVVQSGAPTENFSSIGRSFFESARSIGRIESELKVSMPFVALATTAVEKELIVYNAVSANGDRMNDFLRIENIENYPDNKFTVYNRWGDKIFEIEKYDNGERVFKGRANISSQSELVSGTYFYVLQIPGVESLRGFIAVKN